MSINIKEVLSECVTSNFVGIQPFAESESVGAIWKLRMANAVKTTPQDSDRTIKIDKAAVEAKSRTFPLDDTIVNLIDKYHLSVIESNATDVTLEERYSIESLFGICVIIGFMANDVAKRSQRGPGQFAILSPLAYQQMVRGNLNGEFKSSTKAQKLSKAITYAGTCHAHTGPYTIRQCEIYVVSEGTPFDCDVLVGYIDGPTDSGLFISPTSIEKTSVDGTPHINYRVGVHADEHTPNYYLKLSLTNNS